MMTSKGSRRSFFGVDATVARQCVDGQGLEDVVVNHAVLTGRVVDWSPACGFEVAFDVACFGGFAVILWLGDGERHVSICPLDDGGEPDLIAEDVVGCNPTLEILQRSGWDILNGLSGPWFAPEIWNRVTEDFGNEAELGWEGYLHHES